MNSNQIKQTSKDTIRTLNQISSIRYGHNFKSADYKDEGIPLIRISNIQNGEIGFEKRTVFLDLEYAKKFQKYLVKKGDILIALSGATTGKCGMYLKDEPALLNQRICCVRITDNQDLREYAYSFLIKNNEKIFDSSYGGAQPNIDQKYIENLKISIPSPKNLKKIVSGLEKIGLIKKEYSNQIKLVNQLINSLIEAGVHGKLTKKWRSENPEIKTSNEHLKQILFKREKEFESVNKKNKNKNKKFLEFKIIGNNKINQTWVDVKLENLVYIAGRIGWRGLKAEEYTESGPLLLNVECLNYGEEVNFEPANHISKERYDESPEIQLKENDILLTKDGNGIGKIGIVKNLKTIATVNSSLLVIRTIDAFIPEYLFYALRGEKMQEIVKSRISGSAVPHIFQKDIKEFILTMPPIEEQKEIVRKINPVIEIAKKLRQTDFNTLNESILSKIFNDI